jgi:starch phosphorylase
MKVLVNGGLNLSELDGWWAEAYTPEVGWAIGDGKEHNDDPAWDAAEAEALYTLLEQEVIPEFYTRDQNGIPTGWVARIRESMARLTPRFSANRTVSEYTERYYIPGAKAFRERAEENGAEGVKLASWRQELEQKWANLHFGEVKVETSGEEHLFEAKVYLNGLDPDSLCVELYAEGINGGDPVRSEMTRERQLVGAEHGYVYCGRVPATRAVGDFTIRMRPYRPGVAVPLEFAQILWQR